MARIFLVLLLMGGLFFIFGILISAIDDCDKPESKKKMINKKNKQIIDNTDN